jgi:hypothetical protein
MYPSQYFFSKFFRTGQSAIQSGLENSSPQMCCNRTCPIFQDGLGWWFKDEAIASGG